MGTLQAAAGDEGAVPSEGDKDALGTLSSLKKFSWISFWIQLGLSLASAGVLFFTITTTQKVLIAVALRSIPPPYHCSNPNQWQLVYSGV